MGNYINSYSNWLKINEKMVSAEQAVNIAKSHGLKLKPYSANNPAPKTNLDKFPKGAPELVSAVSTHGSANFESDLIDIVDMIQDETKITLNITGGDDHFHRGRGSRHTSGQAIDFVIDGTASNDDQSKIEHVIIKIMKSGKYPHLGMINEYKNPSGHATGGHFHLSVGSSTEYSYFHFVKDANGKTLTGKGSDFDNKILAIGGTAGNGKIYQGQKIDAVNVTANKSNGSVITGTTETMPNSSDDVVRYDIKTF